MSLYIWYGYSFLQSASAIYGSRLRPSAYGEARQRKASTGQIAVGGLRWLIADIGFVLASACM